MDDIVKQAMNKWPDVPYCYGWLALDGRGAWRMRNERVQQTGLLGDKIQNPAMRAFIARNYAQDKRGCWFFQNGPQRVYVNLSRPRTSRTPTRSRVSSCIRANRYPCSTAPGSPKKAN